MKKKISLVLAFLMAATMLAGCKKTDEETAGLPEKLLFENADKCVRIPMIDEARSLNLSNAVAIGVYETLRQWDYPQLLESGELRDYLWADQQ